MSEQKHQEQVSPPNQPLAKGKEKYDRKVVRRVVNKTAYPVKIALVSGGECELGPKSGRDFRPGEADVEALVKLVKAGKIEMDERDERVAICNRTPYRIAIGRVDIKESGDRLVIPAFGSREITAEEASCYEVERWERANLVQERSAEPMEAPVRGTLLIGFTILYWIAAPAFLVIVNKQTGVFWQIVQRFYWFWAAGMNVLLLLAASLWIWKELRRNLGQFLIGFSTVLIAVGGPLLVIFWEPDGFGLEGPSSTPGSLARYVQFIFISIASSTPAALFFLFDRQRVRTLRDSFFREVTRLDPQIKSLDDAESIYGARVSEAYGVPAGNPGGTQAGNIYGDADATLSSRLITAKRLPVIIATILVTAGWLLVLRVGKNFHPAGDALEFFRPNANLIAFGFLGSYFFGLNMVFRRYARSDLKPKAYSHLVVRILTVSTICLVLSLFPVSAIQEAVNDKVATTSPAGTNALGTGTNAPTTNSSKTSAVPKLSSSGFDLLLMFAFIIGVFPETGVNFIAETLRERKSFRKVLPSLREKQSLSALEGISLYDRTRLMEEGVENIENLAHHDLIDLIVHTRIPVPRLVDWVDQAILYLHLGVENDFENAGEDKPATAEDADVGRRNLQVLKQNGIRNATGLERAFENAPDKKLFSEMLGNSNGGPPPLEVIRHAIAGEQWMSNIRWWRRFGELKDVTLELKDFQDS